MFSLAPKNGGRKGGGEDFTNYNLNFFKKKEAAINHLIFFDRGKCFQKFMNFRQFHFKMTGSFLFYSNQSTWFLYFNQNQSFLPFFLPPVFFGFGFCSCRLLPNKIKNLIRAVNTIHSYNQGNRNGRGCGRGRGQNVGEISKNLENHSRKWNVYNFSSFFTRIIIDCIHILKVLMS